MKANDLKESELKTNISDISNGWMHQILKAQLHDFATLRLISYKYVVEHYEKNMIIH